MSLDPSVVDWSRFGFRRFRCTHDTLFGTIGRWIVDGMKALVLDRLEWAVVFIFDIIGIFDSTIGLTLLPGISFFINPRLGLFDSFVEFQLLVLLQSARGYLQT